VIYGLFYPTPYLRQLLRKVPVMVVDRDQTPLSRQVARWLDASEGAVIGGRTNNLDAAQEAVRAGTVGGVVLIPKDFEKKVLRGEPAYMAAYADASYLLVYRTVTGAVNGVAGTLSAGVSVRRLQAGGAGDPGRRRRVPHSVHRRHHAPRADHPGAVRAARDLDHRARGDLHSRIVLVGGELPR